MIPNPAITTRVRRYGMAAIGDAATIVKGGGCVAIPTETVYGLAADATNARAVAGIYAAKGRPSFNPLIVHVPDLDAAHGIGRFDDRALGLAERHWPGPLTLVVPRTQDCPVASLATAGLDTIAIRVPAHRAMRALLTATKVPLAAPSANASGAISPTRAEHVVHSLGGRIPLVIDDGATAIGLESTIVKIDADGLMLLRHGPLIFDAAIAAAAKIEAPGQLSGHYAPVKPLRLNAVEAAPGEWLIGFGRVSGDDTLSAWGDTVEAAARLFNCMHRADASEAPMIAVAPVPDAGLGRAINDRLMRAAAG